MSSLYTYPAGAGTDVAGATAATMKATERIERERISNSS